MIDEFRRLLDESGTERDRDIVATYAFDLARRELLLRKRRWRSGFSDSPTDIACMAADEAAARLLPPVTTPYAKLRSNMASICRQIEAEAAYALERKDASQIGDDVLRVTFDALLSHIARRCLIDRWREQNPEIHALSVRLTKHIAKSAGLAVAKRHRWYRIVRSPASELAKPPMSAADLERNLGTALRAGDGAARTRLDRLSPDLFDGLREVLMPEVEHGGYVYLLDLCRAILAWRSGFVTTPLVVVPTVSEADANRAYRDDLRGTAQREMKGFLERGTLSEVERRYRGPLVETAVEACSRPDFGSPDFAGMNQREVFLSQVDGVPHDLYEQVSGRIDFLVRRIRSRCRPAAPPPTSGGPAP